jgi:hypothetical protein
MEGAGARPVRGAMPRSVISRQTSPPSRQSPTGGRPTDETAPGAPASGHGRSRSRISLLTYLLVGGALVLFALWAINPMPCSDLWWQMKTGELIWTERAIPQTDRFSFMAEGRPWIIQEWASELFFFLVFTKLGPSTLVLFKMLAFAAAIGLAFAAAWTRCRGALTALATALLVGYSAHFFADMRPQMFTYVFLGALLLLLERDRSVPGSRARWLIPPLMLLWVNFHAAYMAGVTLILATLAGDAVEAWLLHRRSDVEVGGRKLEQDTATSQTLSRWRRLLLPAGLALLATCLNPYGPEIYLYPLTLLRHQSMLNFVQEWFSPDFHDSWMKGYEACLFLVPAALMYSRRPKRPADMLLLLFWTYQSLQSRRHIPIFLIMALPVLADHLAGCGERAMEWLRERGWGPAISTIRATAATALMLGIGLGIARAGSSLPHGNLFEHSGALWFYPRAACDFIEKQRWSGRMYNEFDWGGYCIWRFFPRQQVFIDGRCEVYFDGAWENHQAVHYAQADWEARLRVARVDTLLVSPDSYLNRVLPTSREWTRIYADSQALVFRRTQPFEQ